MPFHLTFCKNDTNCSICFGILKQYSLIIHAHGVMICKQCINTLHTNLIPAYEFKIQQDIDEHNKRCEELAILHKNKLEMDNKTRNIVHKVRDNIFKTLKKDYNVKKGNSTATFLSVLVYPKDIPYYDTDKERDEYESTRWKDKQFSDDIKYILYAINTPKINIVIDSIGNEAGNVRMMFHYSRSYLNLLLKKSFTPTEAQNAPMFENVQTEVVDDTILPLLQLNIKNSSTNMMSEIKQFIEDTKPMYETYKKDVDTLLFEQKRYPYFNNWKK